jgi:hypothetical protein
MLLSFSFAGIQGGYPDCCEPAKFKQCGKRETGLMNNLDQRRSGLSHPNWDRLGVAAVTPHDITRLLVHIMSANNGKAFTAKRVKAVLDGDF